MSFFFILLFFFTLIYSLFFLFFVFCNLLIFFIILPIYQQIIKYTNLSATFSRLYFALHCFNEYTPTGTPESGSGLSYAVFYDFNNEVIYRHL